MKPASARQKGRLFQQNVRDKILKTFPELEPDDVRSTSMGASGEDLQLSPAARRLLGISIECKRVEKIQIWSAWAQASSNAPDGAEPVVVFRRNQSPTLVTVELDFFLHLIRRANG